MKSIQMSHVIASTGLRDDEGAAKNAGKNQSLSGLNRS